MQTIYYTTSNFIRHESNVVDFNEYRRKLALADEGSLAPKPQLEDYASDSFEEAWERPVLREVTPRPRRSRRQTGAWALDIGASLGVVVMTLTFTLQILLG